MTTPRAQNVHIAAIIGSVVLLVVAPSLTRTLGLASVVKIKIPLEQDSLSLVQQPEVGCCRCVVAVVSGAGDLQQHWRRSCPERRQGRTSQKVGSRWSWHSVQPVTCEICTDMTQESLLNELDRQKLDLNAPARADLGTTDVEPVSPVSPTAGEAVCT